MRRFCNVWIFWIISYVAGSLPSNLRHRCTFMGFSNSSDNAAMSTRKKERKKETTKPSESLSLPATRRIEKDRTFDFGFFLQQIFLQAKHFSFQIIGLAALFFADHQFPHDVCETIQRHWKVKEMHNKERKGQNCSNCSIDNHHPAQCCMRKKRRRLPLTFNFNTRKSFKRSWYWASPCRKVDCWILIFSYSNANSSLRRINWVPAM